MHIDVYQVYKYYYIAIALFVFPLFFISFFRFYLIKTNLGISY